MSRRQSKQGPSTVRRLLDAAALAILLAGSLYLALGRGADRAQPVSFPPVSTETDPSGSRFIVVEHAALQTAFEKAGLPDPPDLTGGDPVPIEKLLGFARQWSETGDVQAVGQLAQIYQALEQHDAALGCFAAAARLDPDSPLWTYGVGVECQMLHLYDAAIANFGKVTEMAPTYATTWARLGTLYLEQGDLDRAETCFNTFRQHEERQTLGLIGLGRVALARGDAGTAEQWFRKAIGQSPQDFMAHRFLGRAFAASGRAGMAQRQQQVADQLPQYSGWLQFDRWLGESHELASTQGYLNNMLRQAAGAGDWPKALQLSRELLDRRPNDWNMLANLARISRQLKRFDEANDAIGRALALAPDNAGLHVAAAEINFMRRDLGATNHSIDRALGLDAAHTGALELRARTLFLQGRFEDASAAARQALEIDPELNSARLVLATILTQLGRRDEAMTVLRELLARDPNNGGARQMLQQLGG